MYTMQHKEKYKSRGICFLQYSDISVLWANTCTQVLWIYMMIQTESCSFSVIIFHVIDQLTVHFVIIIIRVVIID